MVKKLFSRQNNLDVAGAHIEKVRTEQVLFALVAHTHLRNGNKILVFTDIIGETLVAERVDFAGDDKAVCPNLY